MAAAETPAAAAEMRYWRSGLPLGHTFGQSYLRELGRRSPSDMAAASSKAPPEPGSPAPGEAG